MSWNIITGAQSNQIFVDGKMLNLTRWPHLTSKDANGEYDRLYAPQNLKATSMSGVAGAYIFNNPSAFPDATTAARWNGAQAWVNLSHNGHDGQGCSGIVNNTSLSSFTISGCDGKGITENPWGLGIGTEFYAFNPIAANVTANGGVTALLAEGEWWKNGNTLYVKLPGGVAPSSTGTGTNVVEAKKRIYCIAPSSIAQTLSNTTIKGFKLFATSITIDNNAVLRTTGTAAAATGNVIDSLDVKYVTHFTDQSGDWQVQWSAQSGIIISGTNNVIKNCNFQYSAASAISVLGTKNKVLNNNMTDMNYNVTEAGAINTGKYGALCTDSEIAYNTITNICEQGSNMRMFKNSDKASPGKARYHHNKISNFMIRNSDSGGFDTAGGIKGMIRIDHNVMDGATNVLAIGIYFDYDLEGIIDHNLFWNVNRPIQCNQQPTVANGTGPIKMYNNTAISSSFSERGIQNGVDTWSPSFDVRNNIASGVIPFGPEGSIISNNFSVTNASMLNTLFNNVSTNDYTLKSDASTVIDQGVILPYTEGYVGSPDLGCYESGTTPWKAGYGNIKPEFALVDSVVSFKANGIPASYSFKVFAVGYCEFPGTSIDLKLGELPTGVTATLSSTSVSPDGSVTLTINTTSALNKSGVLTLTGTSGIYSFTRSYPFVANPVLTTISIAAPPATALQTVNSFYTFTAKGYDQDGKLLDPQPSFTWTCTPTSGTIGSVSGKYVVKSFADPVSVTATSSSSLSSTFTFKTPYSPTAIDEVMNDIFDVYPNPAQSDLTVKMPFDKGENASLKIIDFTGRVVLNKQITSFEKEIISVSELSNGIYLLVASQGNKQVSRKIVVRK
jgi:hypothetical protein